MGSSIDYIRKEYNSSSNVNQSLLCYWVPQISYKI